MAGRAKAKDELNYRNGKGLVKCSRCREFLRVSIEGIGGEHLGVQERCAPIGTGNSRKYRIRPDGVCDRFEPRET